MFLNGGEGVFTHHLGRVQLLSKNVE